MNSRQMFTWARYRAFARQSNAALTAMKDCWSGEDVYCVGTGPSINETDLKKLDGKRVIFLNNAFTLLSEFEPNDPVCMITDDLRAMELRGALSRQKIRVVCSTDRVLNPDVDPSIFRAPFTFVMPKLDVSTTSRHVNMAISTKMSLSADLQSGVYLGKSVLFPAIQLAAYMGARSIVLVGIDMNMNQGVYFSSAIRGNWSGFDYPRDGEPYLENLHEFLLSRSINLINASQGGIVEAIPRNWDLLAKKTEKALG
ncbi:MAG: hypothetical protein ACXW23_18010 [Telluria sp.]